MNTTTPNTKKVLRHLVSAMRVNTIVPTKPMSVVANDRAVAVVWLVSPTVTRKYVLYEPNVLATNVKNP